MEISSAHHQLLASHPLEEVLGCPNNQNQNILLHHQIQQDQLQENQSQVLNEQHKKPRPHPDQALKCPRCDSTNTKFCYYNNYSLSQPRYFCKSCRRYWTQGGSLRNVPVGGGCRKNKRSSPSPSNPSPTPKKLQENPRSISPMSNPNPNTSPLFSSLLPPPSDLTLAFACGLNKTNMIPLMHEGYPNPNGFLDILRGGGFGDNNGNGTNNSTNNNGGFQGFYYGFGTNNGTEVDQVGSGNGEEMVMPSFEANAANGSVVEGSGPVEGANGGGANAVENGMMQGSISSSCKETLDGGLQWQQLDGNGNGNVTGNGNGNGNGNESGNGLVLDSARDYWNNVSSVSSPWYSLVNSSMM